LGSIGRLGLEIVGVDNKMREIFFGPDGSAVTNRTRIQAALGGGYIQHDLDVRDRAGIERIFNHFGRAVELVIHTAAPRSHRWNRDPQGTVAVLMAHGAPHPTNQDGI
jgi:CDP-paratose 2-epimerase